MFQFKRCKNCEKDWVCDFQTLLTNCQQYKDVIYANSYLGKTAILCFQCYFLDVQFVAFHVTDLLL